MEEGCGVDGSYQEGGKDVKKLSLGTGSEPLEKGGRTAEQDWLMI